MAKRGRKPKNTDKNYFGKEQEEAVKEYLHHNRLCNEYTLRYIEIITGKSKEYIQNVVKDKENSICLYDFIRDAEEKEKTITDIDLIEDIKEINALIYAEKKETDRIYNEVLKPAFIKMIESIIRSYHLYVPEETFAETFNDTLSFLVSRFNKFDCDREKKAYSYYGNVCKNYLIGRNEAYIKNQQRNPSYDVEQQEEFTNNIRYANKVDKNQKIAAESVVKLVDKITKMVDNPIENGLKENEVKIGKALINLFENWDFVLSTDGSNKLNKNAVLFFLKEQTGLDAKGIRDNMKKYKKEYLIVKDSIIN